MYKQSLALNNQQGLIYLITKPNQTQTYSSLIPEEKPQFLLSLEEEDTAICLL